MLISNSGFQKGFKVPSLEACYHGLENGSEILGGTE